MSNKRKNHRIVWIVLAVLMVVTAVIPVVAHLF